MNNNSLPPEDLPTAHPPPQVPVHWSFHARSSVVTYVLIGVTVLMYLGQMLGQSITGGDILAIYGAKINSAILQGEIWRFITPMFLHGSILHIGFNMYALYSLGTALERHYGNGRFAALYFLSGFAGNVISFVLSKSASYGASTAVFGLVAAEIVFIWKNKRLFRNARAALVNTIGIVVINLFIVLSPGIDNWGHLGGLLGGFAFAWFAGPVWKPDMQLDGIHVVDAVPSDRAWQAGGLVAFVFVVIALLKMLAA